MAKFADTNEKIAERAVAGYKKIESAALRGYKAIEESAVRGFNVVSDKIIEKVFAKEGESTEQAKKRLSGED